MPSLANQDQQVAQHPSWVHRKGRRIRKADETVLGLRVLEEARLVAWKRAYPPQKSQLTEARRSCALRSLRTKIAVFFLLFDFAPASLPLLLEHGLSQALGQEEAVLAGVHAVFPCLHSIYQQRRLFLFQLRRGRFRVFRWCNQAPLWVWVEGGVAEVVGEFVLFQIGIA